MGTEVRMKGRLDLLGMQGKFLATGLQESDVRSLLKTKERADKVKAYITSFRNNLRFVLNNLATSQTPFENFKFSNTYAGREEELTPLLAGIMDYADLTELVAPFFQECQEIIKAVREKLPRVLEAKAKQASEDELKALRKITLTVRKNQETISDNTAPLKLLIDAAADLLKIITKEFPPLNAGANPTSATPGQPRKRPPELTLEERVLDQLSFGPMQFHKLFSALQVHIPNTTVDEVWNLLGRLELAGSLRQYTKPSTTGGEEKWVKRTDADVSPPSTNGSTRPASPPTERPAARPSPALPAQPKSLPSAAPKPPPLTAGTAPKTTIQQAIINFLRDHGPQTSGQLAKGVPHKSPKSFYVLLGKLKREGKVAQPGGKGTPYVLTGEQALPAPPSGTDASGSQLPISLTLSPLVIARSPVLGTTKQSPEQEFVIPPSSPVIPTESAAYSPSAPAGDKPSTNGPEIPFGSKGYYEALLQQPDGNLVPCRILAWPSDTTALIIIDGSQSGTTINSTNGDRLYQRPTPSLNALDLLQSLLESLPPHQIAKLLQDLALTRSDLASALNDYFPFGYQIAPPLPIPQETVK